MRVEAREGAARTVLLLRRVEHRFGSVVALNDVSLRLREGQCVGLVGPKGSGKSTLFRIAAGMLRPDAGDVTLAPARLSGTAEQVSVRLGFVFDQCCCDKGMRVSGLLREHGAIFGLFGRRLKARVAEVSGLLGIEALANRRVAALSLAERRRVNIARALMNRPELLLLDSPVAGLEDAERRRIAGIVWSHARRWGMTMLWATRAEDEVGQAERVAVLSDGRLSFDGPFGPVEPSSDQRSPAPTAAGFLRPDC